ncbi:MAG: WD40 repeat domain-containing protein [Pirellulales bacterium]
MTSPPRNDVRRFARNAIVLYGDEQLRTGSSPINSPCTSLDAARRLCWFDWRPGNKLELVGDGAPRELTAPQVPAPCQVRRVALADVSQAAVAGVAPDSVVRFAPDSRRLAIGTFDGELMVIDAYTGARLFEHRIPEGMIKSLAWSPDGRWLYAGEQSPDALLLAIDTGAPPEPEKSVSDEAQSGTAPRYSIAWRFRFADRVETSRPATGDRYAIYTLPAVHDLQVADDGRVFAVATHSWSREGELANRSLAACFAASGDSLWTMPRHDAWQLTIAHFAIDRAGTRLAFLPNRTQPAVPAAESALGGSAIEPGNLYLVDAARGEALDRLALEPYAPHFDRVEAWDSVAVSDDGSRVAAGLVDGRVVLCEVTDARLSLLRTLELGAPRIVGELPIAAACSYTRFSGQTLVMQTQNTHIPFGNPQAANQAPSPHPGANLLTVADLEGRELWKYQGPFAISGAWSDASGRWLMVTCRELPGADERGQFGFLLFDTQRAGGGADKLVYYYATDGPVIFSADLSPDGRLAAVVEVPAPTPDGRDLYGQHQVHIVH